MYVHQFVQIFRPKKNPRQVCPARRLRGRVQERSPDQQLPDSWYLHSGHTLTAHLSRKVRIERLAEL